MTNPKKPQVFNLKKSVQQQNLGMQRAAQARASDLAAARIVARKLASLDPNRECDADQVQAELIPIGIELGNAAGSIFKTAEWEFTGRVRRSHRVDAHAHLMRIWRLK